MLRESSPSRSEAFLAIHARLVEWLLAKAEAARWGLSRVRFAQALQRSAEHRFRGADPTAAEVAAYLQSLHVDDLALACACSDGNEKAWEHFIHHYRQDLHAAARAVMCSMPPGGQAGSRAADDVRARDLADSIYAELYGLGPARTDGIGARTDEGGRRSLFDYFHGRSKLSTWLRAVLAQRHIDALRAERRTEPLEEDEARAYGQATPHNEGGAAEPDRARYVAALQAALLEALAALDPRDRLRLSHYYVQELTLAQIGRILGEHEATASRSLERTRRELRKQVERFLRDTKKMSDAQIRLCFECARDAWPFDLTRALSGGLPGPKLEDD